MLYSRTHMATVGVKGLSPVCTKCTLTRSRVEQQIHGGIGLGEGISDIKMCSTLHVVLNGVLYACVPPPAKWVGPVPRNTGRCRFDL